MKITNKQHAVNVKNMILNMADAAHNAISRGDDPRSCKKFKLYLNQTNDYLNKHKLMNNN